MSDKIEKTLILKAPIERIWRALTNHDEFGTWFRVKLDEPFALGEISTGHITYPGYENLRWQAEITRMEAPHHFAFTWHPYAVDPDVDYSGEAQTLVEFRLDTVPDGTKLTVVESGFDALPRHRHADALRMNDRGWSIQTQNIKDYLGG